MSLYNFIETPIQGCILIEPKVFKDFRGKLIKVYHEDHFKERGLCHHFKEEYCSVSKKGVLRGLHFQNPPDAHIKLVTCLSGSILDVIVDLRKNSNSFGKTFAVELSSDKNNLLYVPEGLAHGFYTQSDNCVFLSLNSKKYSPDCDAGIRWDSIEYDWPIKDPILSEKDKNLIGFSDFDSPFK